MKAAWLMAAFVATSMPSPSACENCGSSNWGYENGAFDQYVIEDTEVTPGGITYDPSGLLVNPEVIDRLTNEVEACIQTSIDRKSFIVKVADNSYIGCSGQELLPVPAPDESCLAKGLEPSESCPCMWRAGINCPNTLVVTPSFYLYKDVLIRWTLNVTDPWTPALAPCANPTTNPDSNGTET